MPRKILVPALLLAASAGAAMAQQEAPRVRVFDSQPVWQQTEEGKKMRARLEAFRDTKSAEIDAKEADLNKLREKLRDQEMSLSDDKKNQMLKEIDQKSIDLKRLNDDATREMKTQFGDAQEQFQKELFQVVEALGKEKKYSLILERTIVVFGDPALDITAEVVAKFNEMFKGTAATPAASPKPKESKPAADAKKPVPDPSKKP